MSKKNKQKKQETQKIPVTLPPKEVVLFCGFPLIERNINQVWRWDNFNDVNFNI